MRTLIIYLPCVHTWEGGYSKQNKEELDVPIKVKSFMGYLGFEMRKIMPKLSSRMYLELQSSLRRKKYIEYAKIRSKMDMIYPVYVAVETINRCNGSCAFCPANHFNEKRPYAKMTDEIFEKILREISTWEDWNGVFSLYVNNEPFIDNRMVELLHKSRIALPKATMLLFSNGTLLTIDIMKKIARDVDVMYINNYSESYELHDNIKDIYNYVKSHESEFENIDILIQKRYVKEVLTNRAGESPNKQKAINSIDDICMVPYTDLTIYPNGQVGLCCSDVLEKMNFGNVQNETLLNIYNGKEMREIRDKMTNGRKNIPICSNCDFMDSGIRINMIENQLRNL